MAKSWTDFTRREKVIGVLVSVFAVFAISGAVSAVNNTHPASPAVEQPAVQKSSSQEKKQGPSITYKELEETQVIAFDKTSKQDSGLSKGTTQITTVGENGIKTITYKITLTDGVETSKEALKEVVTKAPISEVVSIGSYVAPVAKKVTSKCDPNYSGCVPIASDVDCGGGSGNGPEYLYGTVSVIGIDIYDLDRNGDGIACE